GIMLLPAISSRFWVDSAGGMIVVAIAVAFVSSVAGLLVSYHYSVPTGPTVILSCGIFYLFSMFAGTRGGMLWRLMPRKHLEA
ncbi:MAG: metal ABC transporter permease, partial [Methyloceanibacter sp.]